MKRPTRCLQHQGGPNRNGSHKDHAMAKRQLPSVDVLRQLLRYEPETGKLFWKSRGTEWFPPGTNPNSWNKRLAGKEAAFDSGQGYYRITVFRVGVGAHRVAWALAHCEWPGGPIDHINGDRRDNRLINLRLSTIAENNRNCRRRRDNSSGMAGVYFCNTFNRWKAEARLNGKKITLGSFSTRDDAIAARIKANEYLPFSMRHGK